MARRDFRRGAAAIRNARMTRWLSIPINQVAVDGTAVLAASLSAEALTLRPFTIVRTRITILQLSDQLAVTEDQVGGFGICVVSESASAAGVASVPTPLTELNSDLWFVHQTMLNSISIAGTVSIGDTRSGTQYIVDSKAMRKVNNDEDVVVVVEGSGTGDGQAISFLGRILVKLH